MGVFQGVENFLPITVVSAIGLFFLKEIFEYFKKRAERKRKISAYKILISEELLKNAWTIKQLKSFMREIDDDVFEGMAYVKSALGEFQIQISRQYGESRSFVLPIVHTAIFDKAVVDMAAIDSEFFEMARAAYEHFAEVKHICNTVLNFAEDKSIESFIKTLPAYANGKLDDADASLKVLFKWCTGKDMEKPKLRSFA